MTNPKLSELTDKLNQEILRAEAALHALQLGVTAAISLDTPPAVRWPGYSLAFGKDNRAWRLLVVKPNGEPILLIRASREMRLDAVQRLPSLLLALESQIKSEETEVEMAIEQARDFTAQVKDKANNWPRK